MSIQVKYRTFHKTEPSSLLEGSLQCPARFLRTGRCRDVGYEILESESSKDGLYVHDCGKGVGFYTPAPRNSNAGVSVAVPVDLWVLGAWTGATVENEQGTREVRGSRQTLLCTNKSGKTLFVVHKSKGLVAVIRGGNLRVVDWIRG